jgi:hypothetical protein
MPIASEWVAIEPAGCAMLTRPGEVTSHDPEPRRQAGHHRPRLADRCALPPCHTDALEVLALAEKIVRLVHTEQTARSGTVLTLVE